MSPEVRKLPPPIQDHLIHLLPQGLHVGIGKASVQRAHAVGVRARVADGVDGAVELSLADVAGWALGAIAAVGAIIAAWDAEVEADIGAIEVHTDGGLLTGIERHHAVHDGLGKGWVLGTVIAGRPLSAVIDVGTATEITLDLCGMPFGIDVKKQNSPAAKPPWPSPSGGEVKIVSLEMHELNSVWPVRK
jgi:hypothetical protein